MAGNPPQVNAGSTFPLQVVPPAFCVVTVVMVVVIVVTVVAVAVVSVVVVVVVAVVLVTLVAVVVEALAILPPEHPQCAAHSSATAGADVQNDLSVSVLHKGWSATSSQIVLQDGHSSAEYLPTPSLHSRWQTEEKASPVHNFWPESEFATSQTDVAATQSQSEPYALPRLDPTIDTANIRDILDLYIMLYLSPPSLLLRVIV